MRILYVNKRKILRDFEKLMKLIYKNGDKGCRAAICLRSDLSQELKECCKKFDDSDMV